MATALYTLTGSTRAIALSKNLQSWKKETTWIMIAKKLFMRIPQNLSVKKRYAIIGKILISGTLMGFVLKRVMKRRQS